MNKGRLIFISVSVFAVLLIYFGCDIKSPELREAEKVRAMDFQPTDFVNIKRAAIDNLSSERRNTIESLDFALEKAEDEDSKVKYHKELSRFWMQFGYPALAGYHAELIAQMVMTGESWSIAGSTYNICLQRAESERQKTLCGNRSVASFENAVSLEPNNLDYRLNLAVTLADHPPENNPMLGVTQLIELNRQNPEYVPALFNLGRLAVETGQYQRAIERLTSAYELEPDNQRVICLLPVAFARVGDEQNARKFSDLCER
jgi:tetratricopeptide (TPR) repeat protein